MRTIEYIFFKVNEGTAREKEIMVEEAYDQNAGLKEYNRYYIAEINDKLVGFPIHTDFDCLKAIAGLGTDERVRIYYGNPATGLCDRDEDFFKHENGRVDLRWDAICEGYLCPSNADFKVRKNDGKDIEVGHLTIHHQQRYFSSVNMLPVVPKFYKVRPEMIVRIEHSNKKYGGIIWSHPDFSLVETII
jgi:hypothetical protein